MPPIPTDFHTFVLAIDGFSMYTLPTHSRVDADTQHTNLRPVMSGGVIGWNSLDKVTVILSIYRELIFVFNSLIAPIIFFAVVSKPLKEIFSKMFFQVVRLPAPVITTSVSEIVVASVSSLGSLPTPVKLPMSFT